MRGASLAGVVMALRRWSWVVARKQPANKPDALDMQAGNGHVTIAGCRETRNCSSTEDAWASSTVIRTRQDESRRALESDAAALLRAAAVVRDGRHVGDGRDADAQRSQ